MRRRQPIMTDWLFTQKEVQASVNLPHTWNAIDGADGGDDYYRGACIYEKKVDCPEYDKERELVFLEFEGVNASATVFVNGEEVAVHHGGYSTFRVNATEYLKSENQIKVIVDNSVNETVYPQKADFTFYGGIYRDVNWLIVDKSHFEVAEWGTPGLHVTPEVQEDGTARVAVRASVNIEADEEDYMVAFFLLDHEGNALQRTTVDVSPSDLLADGGFIIENPHLWHGLKDPYLYSMVCVLLRGTEEIDEIGCDFGIRTIKVDPKKGFFLNGELYPLRGVSRHQDRKGLGNAITYEMMDEDMSLIKEVGANTIRLAHYQHNQYFYDLCDREGMVVWAEIPYISAYMKDGDKNTHDQMTELIIQNYNHPSIVTWGLSNEITIDNKKSRGDNLKNHESLNELVHRLDPSRPTSMACFAMCTPFHPVTKIPDIIGWNLYLGWYVPGFFLNDWFMGFFHTIRPNMALGYSEYGAEGMPNLHSENPRRGDNTEEYQCIYHEYMLRCFERHPYLWSTYVWNMFDFAADARNQGGEPGMNHKGLVTFDRKVKKDSFYLYKAYWSDEPFVHICSKRFMYHNKTTLRIKVYSNQKQVSLFVGEKLIETQIGEKVFMFDVPLDGQINVKAVSENLVDEAIFKFSKEDHPEYKMAKQKSNATANWM